MPALTRLRSCYIVAALSGLLLTGCQAPQPEPPATPVPEPSDGLRESGPERHERVAPQQYRRPRSPNR